MATALAVLSVPVELLPPGKEAPEILGPESPYEIGRVKLVNEYAAIIKRAQAITEVTTPEQAEELNQFGNLLAAGAKEATTFFKPVKQKLDALKDVILDHEKNFAGVIDVEKRRLGGLITAWNKKVAEEAEVERKRLQAIADAAMQAEREEQERLARERQLELAIEAEESGDLGTMEQILEEETPVQPIYHAPVVIQVQAPPKAKGQVAAAVYGARVIGWVEGTKGTASKPLNDPGWKNLRLLLEAIIKGEAPIQAVMPNESYIRNKGKLEKEGFSMAGCESVKDESTHWRS